MGLELSVLGIRKIRDEEVKQVTGKTCEKMAKSDYFINLFPKSPPNSWYMCYFEDRYRQDNMRSVRHMLTPVRDSEGKTVYVFWVEELGYFWHKDPYDRSRIEMLLEDMRDDMDWGDSFHVVPYNYIRSYTDCGPSIEDTDEEVVGFIYG